MSRIPRESLETEGPAVPGLAGVVRNGMDLERTCAKRLKTFRPWTGTWLERCDPTDGSNHSIQHVHLSPELLPGIVVLQADRLGEMT